MLDEDAKWISFMRIVFLFSLFLIHVGMRALSSCITDMTSEANGLWYILQTTNYI